MLIYVCWISTILFDFFGTSLRSCFFFRCTSRLQNIRLLLWEFLPLWDILIVESWCLSYFSKVCRDFKSPIKCRMRQIWLEKHVSHMPNCKLQLTSKYLATTTVFDFGALSHLVFFFSVGLLWEILSTSVSRKKYYFCWWNW